MSRLLSIFYLNQVLLLSSTASVSAATLYHSSDFESGNDGWMHPAPSGNQTSVQTESPFNQILLVTSSGAAGPGSRLVVPNFTTNWRGNYSSDGITGVEFDIVNNSGIVLQIRIGLEGSPGNRWTSATPLTLTPSERGRFRMNLDAASLQSAGTGTLTDALNSVTQLRILHNPTAGDFKGAEVSGSFTLDNVTLVPEPSSTALTALGLSFFLLRRRKQT